MPVSSSSIIAEPQLPTREPVVSESESGLRTSASAGLVVDRETRAVIESLSAVADAAELHEVKDDLHRDLPPAAAQHAAELVDRYYQYRIALKERGLPNEVAATPQDAAFALDRLHALRVEFFGEELAQLWFADEEKIGRDSIAAAQRR
jgi:hypothetical protein